MWLLRLLRKIAQLENRRLGAQLRQRPAAEVEARLEALRSEARALIAAQPELPLEAPPPPADEQQAALRAIHAARGTPKHVPLVRGFAQQNLGLAYKYAERWRCAEIPLGDLRQEAVVGLLDAIHRWEPGHGASFASYALWRMRAHMQEYVRKKWPIVHLPGNVRADQQKIGTAFRQLQAWLGRRPLMRELRHALPELSLQRIEVALAFIGGVKVGQLQEEAH